MMTICFAYFKSLQLANLAAALYSVRMQDLSRVKELVIIDNDTDDSEQTIIDVIKSLDFPIHVSLLSVKHKDPTKTHSWSTNAAVSKVSTSWLLFTRADYVLDFNLVDKVLNIVDRKPSDWNGFVTANGYHLNADVGICEQMAWRTVGSFVFRELAGTVVDYTCIDAGVWAAKRRSFDMAHGLDERLTAWGHAQTHFQWKLHEAGVEFVRIPEVLFYHPQHSAQRDLDLAHRQLCDRGIDVRELWARYEGFQPYGRKVS